MDLHPLEIKVLEGLKKLGGKETASKVALASGIEKIQAERFGYSLSQKGLVNLEKKVTEKTKLTERGKEYLEKGLPERRILKAIESQRLNLTKISEITGLIEKEINASLGILNNNNYASLYTHDTEGLVLGITEIGKIYLREKGDVEQALEDISVEKAVESTIVAQLMRRGIAVLEGHTEYILELTEKGKEFSIEAEETAHQLTHEMLKTGSWKEKKLRGYDLKAAVPAFYGGKLHPLTIAINKIRRIFFDLGFEEAEGPLIESSFWNFDALFQPQDHPARDLADTFYMKSPAECRLP